MGTLRRIIGITLLTGAMAVAVAPAASAATTQDFDGFGAGGDPNTAGLVAVLDARHRAQQAGYADPANQCGTIGYQVNQLSPTYYHGFARIRCTA